MNIELLNKDYLDILDQLRCLRMKQERSWIGLLVVVTHGLYTAAHGVSIEYKVCLFHLVQK